MNIKLLTYEELEAANQALLEEFKNIIKSELSDWLRAKKWIRSKELQKITGWSSSSIQTYRANGTLKYSKLGGTVFYDLENLLEKLESNTKHNKH